MSRLTDLMLFKQDVEKLYTMLAYGKFAIGEFISTRSNLVLSTFLSRSELPEFQHYGNDLAHSYRKLVDENNNILEQVRGIIDEIEKNIQLHVNTHFTEEYHKLIEEPIAEIEIDDGEINYKLKSRIESYSDWHYPALQINAKYPKYINYMVTCEPLYLAVNYGHIDVDVLIDHYPPEFQTRLRMYDVTKIYEENYLPKQQFSFILAWDVFTVLHINRVKYHLVNIFNLLRPGGIFMFNYNNCDLIDSIYYVENKIRSYLTKTALTALCKELGYEIVELVDDESANNRGQITSWAEIKRPGTLSTTKANPVVGNIKQK